MESSFGLKLGDNMYEVEFPKYYSVFESTYLGIRFKVPVYPWEALEPYWASIAVAISKVLIYHRFSPNCYKDHHLWRQNRMGLEALQFADLLTRDRGFRWSVKQFNAQVNTLKFGADWLSPFDTGQSVDWFNHAAQLGQLINNSMTFLRKTGYLLVYGDLVKIIRPYWLPPAEWAIRRDWGKQTCEFIARYLREKGKYPSLKTIAEYWHVPRYTLIDAGFTRNVIYDIYKYYRKTGKVKIIKPEKEYKVLSEDEQRALAEKIARRTYGRIPP